MSGNGGDNRRAAPGYLVAGRYRLLRRIGSGGMGSVWLANDQLLAREVALKQITPTPGSSQAQAEEQKQRFLREGRIAARLTHPHAIAMYDVAVEAGEPWLVMEYLPSRSLATVLANGATLPADEVAQIGAQLADALAAAHGAGIVHRDVKPGNVLIADAGPAEGTVKITDFGISRAHGDVALTQTGIINGTPAYLAPEVARGHDPTEASDVFALAATLFTAVEGTPPFGLDPNPMALLHRVAAGEIDQPHHAGAMTSTLLWMLEPDPARRPTMPQARDELARVAAGRGGDTRSVLSARTSVAAAPSSPPPPTARYAPVTDPQDGRTSAQPGPRRGRRVLGVAVAAVLVAAGVALAVSLGSDDTSTGASPTAAPAAAATSAPATPVPATSTTATKAATTTAESSTPTTTTPEPTTTTPAPTTTPPPATTAAAAASGDAAQALVRDYYGMLPADTQAAWSRLGPGLQAQGFGSFNSFWKGFRDISLTSASSPDNGATVLVDVVFTRPNGSTVAETHRLQMSTGPDGAPVIDSDTLVSSRSGR